MLENKLKSLILLHFWGIRIQLYTLVRELIIANPGHWDMSYIFGILRSVRIQNGIFRIPTLPSPGEIRVLNSGKIRIFAGFEFSGLKPIQIDGELNSK